MSRCAEYALACLICVLVLLTISPSARAQDAPPGPPQFVSPPIHQGRDVVSELAREGKIVGGWLLFGAPALAKPTGITAAPLSSSFTLSSESATTAVDVVNQLNSYQGETAITLSSNGTSSLLAGGYNSIFPGNCSASLANCAPGASVSSDGLHWTTSNIPIVGNLLGFDPSLSTDSSGLIYYGYGVCSGSCSSANLMVATSTNGTQWTGSAVTARQGGIFDDKPWVAADPNSLRRGRVYIAWDRNQGNNQTILVSTSTNSGVIWSKPVKVNDGSSFQRVIYAMPAVDPNSGTVYVVWMDYARKALFVDKSSNGGISWGTDVKVASLSVTFVDIGCDGGRSMTPAPYIAVDAQGYIYVTFADQKGTTGMDVYLVYSKDGGKTWLGPFRVNDVATNHQYNPALSVLGNGLIHVSWLDRREDPTNCYGRTYSTYSDGTFAADGVTPNFSANVAISGASDFDGNPNGPGDYTGNVAYFTSSTTTGATPLFPTHLQSDINLQTGTAGGFECYASQVTP